MPENSRSPGDRDSGLDATVAQQDSSSLNPYGQLFRMLLPRALNIAIHDRNGLLLWSADACDSPELQQLVEDEIARNQLDPNDSGLYQGRLQQVEHDHAYVFPLRDVAGHLLGLVALLLSERTTTSARSADSLASLLRPGLDVLSRELANQYNIESLQRDLRIRDSDLDVVLDDDTTAHENTNEVDDFARLLKACLTHLGSAVGTLLVPERNIAVYRTNDQVSPTVASELLNKTHRHLFSLAQVQRRTVLLNRPIDTGPMAGIDHKILACPVLLDARRVVGVLVFFKPGHAADFALREIHLVELLARRITQILRHAYDAATGLLTRPALEKRVMRAARAGNATHHVIYVDIDRLHVLNDIYGMHIGDEVIARVAAVLRTAISARTFAAKISGDRFALFMHASTLAEASKQAETLCRAISSMGYTLGTKTLDVSASFGVAPVEATEHPLSHALASAEAACKAAKDRGRGRVELFQDADHSIIRRVEDVSLIGAIREALDQDRFRLHAQPIVDLQNDSGKRHFELLLRMSDEQGQPIAAEKFLTAAERYQLAPAIDRWVVNYVLEVISVAAPQLRRVGACFAVNLSGQSLSDDEFLNFLETKLREHAAIASLISFEVTETAAVSNIVRAESLMRKLRTLGHEIALDDFGKGLSSLSYLKSLPVNCVKIDGELIRDLVQNPRSQAMVSAVVQLARAMKLTTTAECIESEAIYRIVKDLGVDHAQGYAIGRPQPLELVLKELLSGQPIANIGMLQAS